MTGPVAAKHHLEVSPKMPRIIFIIFATTIAALSSYGSPATANDHLGYSGMTQASPNTFLTVNDRKHPIESGYRLSIIALTALDGVVVTPISVPDWTVRSAPSDLEAVCAIPGREGDNGPFHSVIYQAGYFIIDQKNKTIRFARNAKPKILSDLSGIKVEALAAPAVNVPNSLYSIATDDERYGGIWRPLFDD